MRRTIAYEYESLPTTGFRTNVLAGVIAGIVEETITYPVDSVKTRMQSFSSKTAKYNVWMTLKVMVKEGGLLRPLRGLNASAAGTAPAHGLYFGFYEMSKSFLSQVTTHNHVNYFLSAAFATAIHDAVNNPTEVIKQRMQMYNSPYTSVIACAKHVYRTEGLRAFYRSYGTQLLIHTPYHTIHFSTYEFFQNLLNPERRYDPMLHVTAGGAAGAAAAAVTTPFDVVKTTLNTQELGAKRMIDAMLQIYANAGMSGFYKGFIPRVLNAVAGLAICWSTYEFFKFYLSGHDNEHYKSSTSGKSQMK